MRYPAIFPRAALFLLMISASACTRAPAPAVLTEINPPSSNQVPTESVSPSPAATSADASTAKEYEDFDRGNFGQSTNIDNRWLPLKPGVQFIYEGFTNDGGNRIPRRLVSTVTDLTKVIDGVRSVVTWDQDMNSGEVVETELAFFAQDKNGNVWRMGEHPEDFENGTFVGASTWISGVGESRAGIEMRGSPTAGSASYSQGWAPAVEFTDRAQVSQLNQFACVKLSCYQDVLITDETSQAEPSAQQLKYYAPGIGNIKVDWRGADQTQETMELVDIVKLSPEALAEVRAAATKLEEHAYQVSQDVYGQTLPSEYPEGTPVVSVKIKPTAQASQGNAQSQSEIVIYASDLRQGNLSELEFWNDPASPGGRMVGITNSGDELNSPPEDDPHATFTIQVQKGIPYRCWIHMKVGAPKGLSQANLFWVQFSDAVDKTGNEAFKIGTDSYLTAQGSNQQGWAWVGCDSAVTNSLVYFKKDGGVTLRMQAGMEGVGFDQIVLSSVKYVEKPPEQPVVTK